MRRLQTDYIHLHQLHRPDVHTNIEKTLDALTYLVRKGKNTALHYTGSKINSFISRMNNSIEELIHLFL
ncbi:MULTISPECIES: aldo/keto reductase [unclassified Paenibacillus]|uniref:aldo/keto reductase n=1 Tax=unclassified Paenibacillus TaxID=185978 RepID=UPI0032D90A15